MSFMFIIATYYWVWRQFYYSMLARVLFNRENMRKMSFKLQILFIIQSLSIMCIWACSELWGWMYLMSNWLWQLQSFRPSLISLVFKRILSLWGNLSKLHVELQRLHWWWHLFYLLGRICFFRRKTAVCIRMQFSLRDLWI